MKNRLVGKKARKRLQLFKGTKQKLGQPPGTPIHIGDVPDFKPHISLYVYDEQQVDEFENVSIPVVQNAISKDKVNWINVEGIHDVNLIRKLCDTFEIHPLTQEDIVNTNLRPKFESYNGYSFVALKMLYLDHESKALLQEQITLLVKGNVVLSFQEKPGDVFSNIRQRIRTGTGRVRSRGPDYLTYALLDAIVDSYYQVVDNTGEKIESLEEDIRNELHPEHLERIYDLKREILFLRKNVLPVREMISKMLVEKELFKETMTIYLKDLTDHITQVSESIGIFAEMASVLVDTYHSFINQKMNQIMKVLTMISTIFLPLNFIAGVYGMNFEYMPELKWRFSYPTVLGLMLITATLMFGFFVRKRWVFEGSTSRRSRR